MNRRGRMNSALRKTEQPGRINSALRTARIDAGFHAIYLHAAPRCVARGWRKHLPGNVGQAFLDRQVFMNALRSGPFLPVACLAHSRILSCCESLTGAAAGVLAVAAVGCNFAARGLTFYSSSA